MAIAICEQRDEASFELSAADAGLSTSDVVQEPVAGAPAIAQRVSRAAKLTLDVTIAGVALLLLAPVLLVVILMIQLESPGTPFYRARRVGYKGRPLDVLKFRKMAHDAKGLPLTLAGDARLTRIGGFMARTRIDELPQLLNVVRGQMSLVGPRPEDPRFVALHAEDYEQILSVRPGITGWSQLAFADESRILDQADPVGHYVDSILPAKVRLDCKYAEHRGIKSDVATMAWTAIAMLSSVEVAVHRENGRLARRKRPQAVTWTAGERAGAESVQRAAA
jgi:lipopolysaccharide/colanic/teichoic acid biosynthesis glycosyltransferase